MLRKNVKYAHLNNFKTIWFRPNPFVGYAFPLKQKGEISFFNDANKQINIQTFPKRDLYRRDFNSCSISLKKGGIYIVFENMFLIQLYSWSSIVQLSQETFCFVVLFPYLILEGRYKVIFNIEVGIEGLNLLFISEHFVFDLNISTN